MSNLASNTISVLGGAAVGAIALYLFDPDHGQSRRSSIVNSANDAVASAGNTVRSSAGSAKKMVGDVSDYAQQLADQIKSHANNASKQA
jgi:gas vesicle protein